jgi:Lrp/AsnC family transcriptional regulator for asnA, asnC and gidA
MRNSKIKIKDNLDDLDKKILEILKNNARTPNTKIAKLLGVSEANIRRRIKILEEKKIIKKYKAEIDYKKIGYNLVWIGLDVRPESIIKTIEEIKKIEEIESFYLSSGDHDIMIEFVYENQEELNNLIQKLEKFEGVERICPAILIEKIS